MSSPILVLPTFLLLAFFGAVDAYLGFDGIQAVSTSQFECLHNNGYSFFVARVFRSNGAFDETGVQNIKNAKAAGWKDVDGYIFPCHSTSCPSAAEQTVSHLKSEGANYGMLWLDLEILNWGTDKTANQKFITEMANELNALGVNWGVYTNNHNWENIVGIDWAGVSSRPLWWANYNGEQSFDKFVPFAGWKKPNIHQYKGTTAGPCSVSMDLNWYP